jgi:hypothetical protein
MESEISRTCGTQGEMRHAYKILARSLEKGTTGRPTLGWNYTDIEQRGYKIMDMT